MIKFLFSFIKAVFKTAVKAPGALKAGVIKSGAPKAVAIKAGAAKNGAAQALLILGLGAAGLVFSGCGGEWTTLMQASRRIDPTPDGPEVDEPPIKSKIEQTTEAAQPGQIPEHAGREGASFKNTSAKENIWTRPANPRNPLKRETIAQAPEDLAGEAERELAKIAPSDKPPEAEPVLTSVLLSPEETRLLEFAKTSFASQGIETSAAFDFFMKQQMIPLIFAQDQELWRAVVGADPEGAEISFMQNGWEKSISSADASRLILEKLSETHAAFLKHNTDNPFSYANLPSPDGGAESAVFLSSFDFDKEQLKTDLSYAKHPPAIVIAGSSLWPDLFNLKPGEGQKLKRRLDNLAFLAEAVYKKDAPLYIIGHCGPFCSSSLAPGARRVHIDPFGNLAFSGDTDAVLEITAKKFLNQHDRERHRKIQEGLSDTADFASHFHAVFSEAERRLGPAQSPKLSSTIYQALSQNGLSKTAGKIQAVAKGRVFSRLTTAEAEQILTSFSKSEKEIWRGITINVFLDNENKREELRRGIASPLFIFAFEGRALTGLQGILQEFGQNVSLLQSESAGASLDWSEEERLQQRRRLFFDSAGLMTLFVLEDNFLAEKNSDAGGGAVNRNKDYRYIIPETDFLRDELGIRIVAGENTLYRSRFAPAFQQGSQQGKGGRFLFFTKAAYASCQSEMQGNGSPQSLAYCMERHADLTNSARSGFAAPSAAGLKLSASPALD